MKFAAALAAAGTLTFGALGIASAATLDIVNGTALTIPTGSSPNDLLGPLGLSDPLAGFGGSYIQLVGEGQILVEYFGKEAGWTNAFSLDGNTITTGVNESSATALQSFTTTSLSAGTLAFNFKANSSTEVANGSANANVTFSPNFFASIVGNPTGTSGDSVWLFLDDGGGNGDDNDYDDMVVRLSVQAVPLPATVWLLGTAVGGLAVRRLRSGRATAGPATA